jgi:hypothetical protein
MICRCERTQALAFGAGEALTFASLVGFGSRPTLV